MPHQNYLRIVLVIGLALAAAGLNGSAAEEKDQPGPPATNAKARRDAARKAYEGAWQRHVQEPERVPGDVSYDWSVRWLQAERDLSRTKAEHIAAFEAHLKRVQFLKEKRTADIRAGESASYELDGAEFFRLEAEDWLAAAKAAGK